METTMTPTRIGKNGNTKIVDMKNGYRDKVTNVNAYEVGVKPDRRGNKMVSNLSNETVRIIFTTTDDENLMTFLKDMHSKLSESKSKLTLPFQMDLTDDSVKEIYKYYDSPDTAKNVVSTIGDRIFVVRPLEQTLAQRQTGAYQQEQIFDTLEGNTLPNSDIVIRIDKPFNGITYCYDGQHGILTSKDAESKTFYLDDTIFILNKKETESYDFTYSPIWTDVKKFEKQWNEETFTLKDLCSFSSVIRNAVESDQKRVLVGQIHFTDGQGSSQLIHKRNEHVSSHSNSQRTKSECNGTKINDVLYDRQYEINEPNDVFPVTYSNNLYSLSEIVPKILFFNQTGEKTFPSRAIPKTFVYNLRSKDYKLMNFDQYLVYIYNSLLSLIEKDTDTGTYIFKKPSMSINSLRNNVSDFSLGNFWVTYSIKPAVVNKWVSVFKSLEFEEDELFDVVQDLIHMANHSTNSTFVKKLSELNNLITDWVGEYYSDAKQILKDANVMDKESLTDAKKAEFDALNGHGDRIRKLLFNTKDQFINLVRLSIQTKPSTQSIIKWTEGIIDVMISGFKSYYKDNTSLFLGGSTGTLHRFNNMDKVFLNKAFVDKVKEETTASDTGLWSRGEGKGFLTVILEFQGTVLYYCPYSKGFVTIENFENHHLSFRSKNPQKDFEYWFPLSSKYNNYISNNDEKNIVNPGGNFVDACKVMLKKSENERDLTDNDDLVDIYEDNISTFKKWIRKAEKHLKAA